MFRMGTDSQGNRTTIEITNWNVEDVLKDMKENKAIYRYKVHAWSKDRVQNAQYRMVDDQLVTRADYDDEAEWFGGAVELPNDPKVGALYRIGSWGDFDYAQGWNEGMSTEDTKNLAYWERNMLALLLAKSMNGATLEGASGWYEHQGEGFEGWSRILSLGNGTITFHVPDDFDLGDLPKIKPNWDGHTTSEKWAFVRELCGIDSNPSSN